MWISDALDELTYDQEEDGVLVRRQRERVVLTRGSWATVMFLYEELDRASGAYDAPKIAIVRFQKWRGGWRKHSALNLASAAQARELQEALARWTPAMSSDERDEPEEPDEPPSADRGAEA
jgi:hypothetical protein